jgi:hypothetical protein
VLKPRRRWNAADQIGSVWRQSEPSPPFVLGWLQIDQARFADFNSSPSKAQPGFADRISGLVKRSHRTPARPLGQVTADVPSRWCRRTRAAGGLFSGLYNIKAPFICQKSGPAYLDGQFFGF